MKNRRIFAILIITLVVNLVLALFFREFLRDNVLVPILYLAFYIRLFLKSIGESCLWPVLILLVMILSFRFFRLRKSDRPKTYGYREEPGYNENGRVAFWLRFIKHKSLGKENLSLVSFRLKELITSVVAYQENLTQKELDEAIDTGGLRLPRNIRAYLDPKNQVTAASPRKASLAEKILVWFKMQTNPNQEAMYSELREVVDYLEKQLEIEYDDRN